MKRGPKKTPDRAKVIRGTFKGKGGKGNDGPAPPVVPALAGDPVMPKWLTGGAAELWRERVAIYQRRGQTVVGCERALAVYCKLEVEIIDRWRTRKPVATPLVNALRYWANEFYDTPAAQHSAGTKAPTANRFTNNAATAPPG